MKVMIRGGGAPYSTSARRVPRSNNTDFKNMLTGGRVPKRFHDVGLHRETNKHKLNGYREWLSAAIKQDLR